MLILESGQLQSAGPGPLSLSVTVSGLKHVSLASPRHVLTGGDGQMGHALHSERSHLSSSYMWHVTCDMLLRYMQSVDITSRWWRDGVNPPLLGETDTLVTCFACCLGSDSRSILDMDTALPGDLCLEPGVVQPPRSVLDITMVGTRSVLLLWAVSTPGDRAPSSPSDVTTVTCYFASHAVLQSTQ